MPAESKQERDRRYAREYRARKRAERAEAARAAADGKAGPMRQSVDASIAVAKWLEASDAAAIAQLRMLADIVDQAHENGDIRVELRVHPQLSKALAESGLTPRVRTQLELRTRKIALATSDAAPSKAGNVVRFPRPAKRTHD